MNRLADFMLILALHGIAVFVLLPISLAQAATLTVTTTTSGIASDGECSLTEAIINANNDASTYPDCVAGNGVDTIELAANTVYVLDSVDNSIDGPNGLPSITSEIIINGHHATIQRGNSVPNLRLLHVSAGGNLQLNNLAHV